MPSHFLVCDTGVSAQEMKLQIDGIRLLSLAALDEFL